MSMLFSYPSVHDLFWIGISTTKYVGDFTMWGYEFMKIEDCCATKRDRGETCVYYQHYVNLRGIILSDLVIPKSICGFSN